MLKFTHGVEVGAHQAYLGHYSRTGDINVKNIAADELEHQRLIKRILKTHRTSTSILFDAPFWVVGNLVAVMCLISPKFLLNRVASLLEKFAVFSYDKLADRFPAYRSNFLEMAEKELEHELYFSKLVP